MVQAAVLILAVAVVFVNGWTDAPNAIACAVSTGAMRYRSAAWMAGICNLLGLLVMCAAGAQVAQTMAGLVDFGSDADAAMAALCAAMLAIVLFAVAAWRFGIPTSESHALIAALTGAALALGGSVGVAAWGRVLAGLGLSIGLGYALGWLCSKALGPLLQHASDTLLDKCQILAAAGMAFMHGAQDGQKFVAVFVVAELLAKDVYQAGAVSLQNHLPVVALCALTMALGTSVGGGRIIELVGGKLVRLQKQEGVAADLGGALCLLAASVWGIPMSTTHTKTTAMMGAAAAAGGKVDISAAGSITLTWVITFPACAAMGWVLAKAFLHIF